MATRRATKKENPGQSWPRSNPGLQDLEILVGEWETEGTHPAFSSPVKGHASFQWLEYAPLLVWHFDWEPTMPPNAISVIGYDEGRKTYSVVYSDERGVARIYSMTLEGHVWKMHRDAPGFSQRMTGTFSDNGNTIQVHGELSRDGKTWGPDLNVTYTRTK